MALGSSSFSFLASCGSTHESGGVMAKAGCFDGRPIVRRSSLARTWLRTLAVRLPAALCIATEALWACTYRSTKFPIMGFQRSASLRRCSVGSSGVHDRVLEPVALGDTCRHGGPQVDLGRVKREAQPSLLFAKRPRAGRGASVGDGVHLSRSWSQSLDGQATSYRYGGIVVHTPT